MTPLQPPRNAYTHSPEQHPNLILGSFQLLFWLVFLPSAWENHIQRLDSDLSKDFSLFRVFTHEQLRKKQVWRFAAEGFVLIPILNSMLVGMFSASAGNSLKTVVVHIFFSLFYSSLFGTMFGLFAGVTFGITFSTVFNATFAVAGVVVTGEIISSTISLALVIGTGIGLWLAIISGVQIKKIGVFAGIAFGVILSGGNTAVGVAGGIATGIGSWMNWWRPAIMSISLIPWHILLYRIDKIRAGKFLSVLHRHIAFWDEWQHLPIRGLDKHLLL
ncbi:MAG: hypothetical protein WBA10_16550, partial [Elainellaceae cyanobacterium]